MARAIAEKLSDVDPTHTERYEENVSAFLQQFEERIARWRQMTAAIQGKEVVAYHNAWPYLAHFTGIRIEQFLEPKPGIPPTPKQLTLLEGYMQERQITIIVQSSYSPARAPQSLAKRTGATVVTLCHGVRELPECSDYVAMLEYNVNQLIEALGP